LSDQAGDTDDGEPGERPEYTPGYYGAFLAFGRPIAVSFQARTRRHETSWLEREITACPSVRA